MADPSGPQPDLDGPAAEALAAAILDGRAVDWGAADSDVGTDYAEEFRVVATLVAVHRVPVAPASSPPTQATHGQVPERQPSTWGPLTRLECIGEGSFGRVFRAWDARLQRHVALKLLHAPATDAVSSPSRAIDEARLLARVRHSHVLTVYGAECLDGEIGIWTEFIEGRTLAAMMRESGPLPPADVIEIGLDLCGALAAVHAAGLLHRDVKAQNVMRESGGRIVLMDFGAGHDLEVPARAGELVGTPLYLAPEILDGGAASTHSDVYALAVLLYFLVTGSHPVSGRTLDEVRAAHREGRAVWPRDEYADVPEPLAKVITQGLVATPSERYPSVGEFEAALRGAQGGVNKPGDWIETTDDAARARRRASLLGRVSVAAGIGLIVIVGALILDLGRWRRHVDRPDFTKATPAVHRILFPRVAVTQVGWPSRDGR